MQRKNTTKNEEGKETGGRTTIRGVREGPQAYLRVEQMRVHHRTFDVVQICVVLKSSLQQTCLLAQLGHMSPVIMGEHLVPKNGICDLKKNIHA